MITMHKGDTFETFINFANEQYRARGMAFAIKIPVPVKVLNRQGNVITKAFFESKAFVDYTGIYEGRPFAFDAKETEDTEGFPLKNLEEHQYKYLQEVHERGGIAFILVSFVKLKKVYRLNWTTLSWYWEQWKKKVRGMSSIKINEFECNCKEINQGRGILLDYLAGLENEADDEGRMVKAAFEMAKKEIQQHANVFEVNETLYDIRPEGITVYTKSCPVRGKTALASILHSLGWETEEKKFDSSRTRFIVLKKTYQVDSVENAI